MVCQTDHSVWQQCKHALTPKTAYILSHRPQVCVPSGACPSADRAWLLLSFTAAGPDQKTCRVSIQGLTRHLSSSLQIHSAIKNEQGPCRFASLLNNKSCKGAEQSLRCQLASLAHWEQVPSAQQSLQGRAAD